MTSRHPLLGPSMTIDCARCPVQHTGCADCMVSAFLASPSVMAGETVLSLDADERAAVDAFARAGLVTRAAASSAVARHRDLPGGRATG